MLSFSMNNAFLLRCCGLLAASSSLLFSSIKSTTTTLSSSTLYTPLGNGLVGVYDHQLVVSNGYGADDYELSKDSRCDFPLDNNWRTINISFPEVSSSNNVNDGDIKAVVIYSQTSVQVSDDIMYSFPGLDNSNYDHQTLIKYDLKSKYFTPLYNCNYQALE